MGGDTTSLHRQSKLSIDCAACQQDLHVGNFGEIESVNPEDTLEMHAVVNLTCRYAESGNTKRQIEVTQDPTLGAKQTAENSIERRHFDVVLTCCFDPRQAHQLSNQQNRSEENDVGVRRSLDLESRLLEYAPQLRQTITPPVIADFVLQDPRET